MNDFYVRLRHFVQRLRESSNKHGFTILETVIAIGAVLVLSAGGIVSFGGITEQARLAKTQSAAKDVYTAAIASLFDNDSLTTPKSVSEQYNSSNDKIRVKVTPFIPPPLIPAMSTANDTTFESKNGQSESLIDIDRVSYQTAISNPTEVTVIDDDITDASESFCVTAVMIENSAISSNSGFCNADSDTPENPGEGGDNGETENPGDGEIIPPVEETQPPVEETPPPVVENALAPKNLKAIPGTNRDIAVSWDPVPNISLAGYTLERSLTPDFAKPLKFAIKSPSTIQLSLEGETDYYYRVKQNDSVEDIWSLIVKATTPAAPMISTWDATSICAATIKLPISGVSGEGYVDWGDGTTSPLTNNPSHGYQGKGKLYQVIKVYGDFSMWGSETLSGPSMSCIQDVNDWGSSEITSLKYAFYNAKTLDSVAPPRSSVTNMAGMFMSSSFNQNIDSWNTSNVTNMSEMFSMAADFSHPLNKWDVSNVTNMSSMFHMTYKFDRPLNNWNTSNVTNMNSMFKNSRMESNLSGWNVKKVTNYADFARSGQLAFKPTYLPKFGQ